MDAAMNVSTFLNHKISMSWVETACFVFVWSGSTYPKLFLKKRPSRDRWAWRGKSVESFKMEVIMAGKKVTWFQGGVGFEAGSDFSQTRRKKSSGTSFILKSWAGMCDCKCLSMLSFVWLLIFISTCFYPLLHLFSLHLCEVLVYCPDVLTS